MYFNNEKEAIKFLIDFVLPYLNSDKPQKTEIDELYHTFSKAKTRLDTNDLTLCLLSHKGNKTVINQIKEYNNIYSNIFKKKYSESYNALISLQNECLKLAPNSDVKDIENFLFQEPYRSDFTINEMIAFDAFMTWIVKTPLNKTFAHNRHLDFINVDDFPHIDKTKTIKEQKKSILKEEFTDILDACFNGNEKKSPIFKGFGKTVIGYSGFSISTILALIEQITSNSVFECLYSIYIPHVLQKDYPQAYELIEKGANFEEVKQILGEHTTEYFHLGKGFDHIGLCPVCRKLFYKNRKDKEYCSKECQNIGSLREYRKREKDKKKRNS